MNSSSKVGPSKDLLLKKVLLTGFLPTNGDPALGLVAILTGLRSLNQSCQHTAGSRRLHFREVALAVLAQKIF